VRDIARLFGEGFEKLLRILEGLLRNGPSMAQAVGNLAGHRPANVILQAGAAFEESFDKLKLGGINRPGG
jgi:hypothetical protein